ncbi:cytochrome P450 2J2-like protein, partial [Leptotrombidium deliense]
MKINLYGNDYFVLSDFETITEAYVKQGQNFSGRPVDEFSLMGLVFGEQMLMRTENKFSEIHRKFILSKLRELGVTKPYFHEVIINQCDSFIAEIERINGQPFDIIEYLDIYTSNVFFTIVFSKSFDKEDAIYKVFRNASKMFFVATPELDGFYTGLWIYLKKRLQFRTYKKLVENQRLVYECGLSLFRERLNSEKVNKTNNDLMDYYIEAYKTDSTNTFT